MAPTRGALGNNEMARTRASSSSDDELVAIARRGDDVDGDAYAELWRRHSPAAYAAARSFTSLDADDVVAEAFTRILVAIRAGGGPMMGFRAYLLTSVRNVAREWGSRHGHVDATDLEDLADPAETEDSAIAAMEAGATASAFRSLPTRWQEVLWYSEVENLKPRHFAPLLGLSANAASALAVRAKQGFRDAWIAHQLKTTEDPRCRATLTLLGAHTRGALSARDERTVTAHVETCVSCALAWEEAQHVSHRLALVLIPLVVGLSGTAAYAAWTQTGATGAAAGGAVALGVRPRPSGKTVGTVVGVAAVSAVIIAGGIAFAAQSSFTATEPDSDDLAAAAPAAAPPAADAPAPAATPPATPPAANATPTAPEQTQDAAPDPAPDRGISRAAQPATPAQPGPAPPAPPPTPTPTPSPSPTPTPTPSSTPSVPPLAAPVMSVDISAGPTVYPLISGVDAEPGAVIEILDEGSRVRATTTADASGAWSVDDLAGGVACATDADAYLPAGVHSLTARQRVGGEVSSASAPATITVATPPSLVSPHDGDVYPGGTFLLQLTGDANALVQRIKLPDPAPCRPTPMALDAAGTFSENFSITDAPGIPVTIGVRYIDASGRHGAARFVTITKS
ncbi:sigma-70 family RNA polymerase sigma factor [Microbacterium sp. X-17]|uniref:sigma-70 family RNA polymerase sigma factor n=1 Tax=Microbacterium sp. X-17 TaxID=3144404 RepID=UPI0031F51355